MSAPLSTSNFNQQGPHSLRPLLVLGVSASISAYKAAEVLRQAQRAGWQVQVVPSPESLHFVGRATWEALTGLNASAQLWEQVDQGAHIELARQADLVAVVPCSANRLAQFAVGLAPDLLGAVVLAAQAPVVLAPAMHSQMWQHPATVANVELLRQRGVTIIEPDRGALAAGDVGVGRLPDPGQIMQQINALYQQSAAQDSSSRSQTQPEMTNWTVGDFSGLHVVISAGGTREPIDPVRYLGNASSGRQGFALAQAALSRGAQVTLVAANVELDPPAGAEVIQVQTALQLQQVMQAQAPHAEVVIMAAAVADWRPAVTHAHKQRKSDLPQARQGQPRTLDLALVENPDILAMLSADRGKANQIVVGFAAETLDGPDGAPTQPDPQQAWDKLAAKGCDLLVVNPVGAEQKLGTGFATIDNQATLYRRDRQVIELGKMSKLKLAHQVLEQILQLLRGV